MRSIFSIPASGCTIKEIIDAPLVHTNHLITPEQQDNPPTVTQSSSARQRRADQLLAQGALSDGGPVRILFDTEPGHEILRSPVDGGDDYGKTLATGVFELSKDCVSVAIHEGSDNRNIHSTHLVML